MTIVIHLVTRMHFSTTDNRKSANLVLSVADINAKCPAGGVMITVIAILIFFITSSNSSVLLMIEQVFTFAHQPYPGNYMILVLEENVARISQSMTLKIEKKNHGFICTYHSDLDCPC